MAGDRYLRNLFMAGALAVIRYAKIHGTKPRPWLTALLARRPTKVAAIALADKLARMAWAMMTKGERYKEPVALVDECKASGATCWPTLRWMLRC
jgi:transposase